MSPRRPLLRRRLRPQFLFHLFECRISIQHTEQETILRQILFFFFDFFAPATVPLQADFEVHLPPVFLCSCHKTLIFLASQATLPIWPNAECSVEMKKSVKNGCGSHFKGAKLPQPEQISSSLFSYAYFLRRLSPYCYVTRDQLCSEGGRKERGMLSNPQLSTVSTATRPKIRVWTL